MSRKFKIIMLISVILLQMTVLAHFKPLGVIPNYTFVCVVVISLISADAESVIISACAGFLTDMFTGAPLGLNTLMCMYFSIVCAIISDVIYNKSVKLMCPVGFAASFLYELLFGIFSTLMRDRSFEIITVLLRALAIAAVNAVLFIPVFLILKRVRFEKKRKGIKYER